MEPCSAAFFLSGARVTTTDMPGSVLPFGTTARIAAIVALFLVALALFSNIAHPRQLDFMSFWAAARLTLAGLPASAYDSAAHVGAQAAVGRFDGFMTFVYPPPFLGVVLPFGLLPFGIATLCWALACLVIAVAALHRTVSGASWHALAFPPFVHNLMIGQAGLLFAALFLMAGRWIESHPFRAGLLLGCLALKPQLGLLLPVALLAGGHWRTISGVVLSAGLIHAAALLAFGAESYRAMLALMPDYSRLALESPLAWRKMASVYASLRLAGLSLETALALHCAVALIAAGLVWHAWRRPATMAAKWALLLCATALASPYMLPYDLAFLLLPFLRLARVGTAPGLLALLWLSTGLGLLGAFGLWSGPNLLPLATIGLLALCWRDARVSRAARA